MTTVEYCLIISFGVFYFWHVYIVERLRKTIGECNEERLRFMNEMYKAKNELLDIQIKETEKPNL